MRTAIGGIILSVLLAGCGAILDMIPTAQQQCERRGGVWRWVEVDGSLHSLCEWR